MFYDFLRPDKCLLQKTLAIWLNIGLFVCFCFVFCLFVCLFLFVCFVLFFCFVVCLFVFLHHDLS